MHRLLRLTCSRSRRCCRLLLLLLLFLLLVQQFLKQVVKQGAVQRQQPRGQAHTRTIRLQQHLQGDEGASERVGEALSE